jgi:hypothetical protein
MWALHNPHSFPNLCRSNPRFAELEAAHKQAQRASGEPTTGDITLQTALADIQESESESDEE